MPAMKSGEMYNDVYTTLVTEYFHCPKSPLSFTYSFISQPNP